MRSETGYQDLTKSSRIRIGLRPGQKNVLLQVVLRDLDATLTAAEANAVHDRIYAGLHGARTVESAVPVGTVRACICADVSRS